MAHYITGAVARTRALDALNRGRSARAALDTAIAGYEAALRLDPDFLWALNELSSSLALRGKVESLHGKDPRASFAAAVQGGERATALDPEFPYPWATRVQLTLYEAEHLLRAGAPPDAPVERGLSLLAELEKRNPDQPLILFGRPALWRSRAQHLIARGEDATMALSGAEAAAGRFAPGAPGRDEIWGLVLATKAQAALGRGGEDAEASVRDACAALARAAADAPFDAEIKLWLAEAHLLSFRLSVQRGRPDAAPLELAFAALSALRGAPPVADSELDDPRMFTTFAEIHAARAGLLLGDPPAADSELAQGIAQANEALARHPRFAAALSVLGRSWLLRARAAGPAPAGKDAASHAAAAFEKAFEANPLLARVEQALLDEARRLEGGKTTK